MTGKRRRDIATVDIQLVEIYEDLANDDQDIRLRAAHTLLSNFAIPDPDSPQKIQTIVQRLFRGLCSSRKAARLGFSVALTEFLAQIFTYPEEQTGFSPSEVLEMLERQTVSDGSTTGQDERDHYFGRLFGAEVIVKSCIFFKPQPSLRLWQTLLQLLCDLAIKKQWLRQECGWLFFTSISYLRRSNLEADFAVALIGALKTNNLVRTPEGVAVWLEVKDCFPDAALPKHVWKHRDPLHKEESSALAEVMKDAKAKQQPELTESAAPQGAGTWSQQLHFSWDVVLRELYLSTDADADANVKRSNGRMTFKKFWHDVVDRSLFLPSSSPERKHWGFLLLAKVLATGPLMCLDDVFTENTMVLLVNHLKIDERYLHKSARKVVQALQVRANREPKIVLPAMKGLSLSPWGLYDFDKVTKTKTVAKLLAVTDLTSLEELVPAICEAMEQSHTDDRKQIGAIRRAFADILVSVCSRVLGIIGDDDSTGTLVAELVIDALIGLSYSKKSLASGDRPIDPLPSSECRAYLRSRIRTCLDESIQTNVSKSHLLRHTVRRLKEIQIQGAGADYTIIEFDTETRDIFDTALKNLRKILKTASRAAATPAETKSAEVLETLYSLAILQLFDEDADAPGILQDLNSYQHRLRHGSSEKDDAEQPDSIIEILLSFASKPSKFFHKTGLQAFRAFSSQISRPGLQSLIRILETKESSRGIQDVFDIEGNADDTMEDIDAIQQNGSGSSSNASGSELLDSDVEQFSEKSSSSDQDLDQVSDDDPAELEEFNAKLAAALGARKGQNDVDAEDSEGSDEDMYEEDMDRAEMAALDEKLAEVFRARKPQSGQKKERRDMKEAIVNLKRRVLDLMDVYLRQEYRNPLTLDLVLPLITVARTTSIKQISNRAHEILQAFCSRCRGSDLLIIDANDAVAGQEVLDYLKKVHREAGLDNSRAHGIACSRASILLVKILVKAQINVAKMVDIYAETRKKQLKDRNCQVPPLFFTEWNNWCVSARDHLAI